MTLAASQGFLAKILRRILQRKTESATHNMKNFETTKALIVTEEFPKAETLQLLYFFKILNLFSPSISSAVYSDNSTYVFFFIDLVK